MAASGNVASSAIKPSSSSSRYRLIGDFANIAVFLNATVFMGAVVWDFLFSPSSQDGESLFDGSFTRDGFCISNPGTWFDSHLLAFYADVIGSAVLAVALSLDRTDDAVSRNVRLNISGILGHGIGHASLALFGPPGGDVSTVSTKVLTGGAVVLVGFWVSLLKAAMPSLKLGLLLLIAVLNTAALMLYVPMQFSFSYVQTVLLCCAAVEQLRLPAAKRGEFQYAAYAVLVALPIGFVGWIESLTCTAFLKGYGGHVWYDATIPATLFLYYVVCRKAKPHTKLE